MDTHYLVRYQRSIQDAIDYGSARFWYSWVTETLAGDTVLIKLQSNDAPNCQYKPYPTSRNHEYDTPIYQWSDSVIA